MKLMYHSIGIVNNRLLINISNYDMVIEIGHPSVLLVFFDVRKECDHSCLMKVNSSKFNLHYNREQHEYVEEKRPQALR